MIRVLVDHGFVAGKRFIEAVGLSTDGKLTGDIITGSLYSEVDTGVKYAFDEITGEWLPQNAGNGKTSIAGATVTLGGALTYTGSEQTKGVSSVVLGTTTLTADTDYTVKDNKGTEIGDYTMYIIGKGSYTGVIPKAWSIGQGVGGVIASPDTLTLTAGSSAGTSTLTVIGDGKVTAASSAKSVATVALSDDTVIVTPIAEGSATVTITLEETEHYSGDTDTISVTVEAAEENPGGE